MTAAVGQSLPRVEDLRLLRGEARFVADKVGRSALHVAILRSTLAHARITAVDSKDARDMPGVIGVYSAHEIAGLARPITALTAPDQVFADATSLQTALVPIPVIAATKVHYVGEPVAVVVAEDRYQAEDALEEIRVDYEPLAPVTDVHESLSRSAPVIHSDAPGNRAAEIAYDFGDRRQDPAAAVTIEQTYRIGRHSGVPLEGRGVRAIPRPRGGIDVFSSTQIPHMLRSAICTSTGWDAQDVGVRVPDVGGGFGPKASIYAEEILVPVLASMLGAEIIWVEDRAEHMVASAQSRDQVHHIRLDVACDGRILAVADDFLVDVGAYSLWTTGVIANTAIHLHGPYRIPKLKVRGRAAYTNKTPTSQYRGAGRPEACFALERALDRAADRLGLPRDVVRSRNLLRHEEMPYGLPLPYRDGQPITLDGGDYGACLDDVMETLPPGAAEKARRDDPRPHLQFGHGVACYIEATARGPYESARVRLLPDGRFAVDTGGADAGQGQATTLAQVAADALGVPISAVKICPTDTDQIDSGIGTFASRTATLAGSAIHLAATQLLKRASQLWTQVHTSKTLARTVGNGGFDRVDQHELRWDKLAAEFRPGGALSGERVLDESATFRPETVTWTMGAHAAVVSVDVRTGLVQVLSYAVSHEGGRLINPAIVDGQIRGGVAQGVGGALLEEFTYDPQGQPTATTLADYHLPGPCEVPRVTVVHNHVATPTNPIGVRGVGESGVIPVYATIASAVDNALADKGVHVTQTPISSARLWAAIHTDDTTDL